MIEVYLSVFDAYVRLLVVAKCAVDTMKKGKLINDLYPCRLDASVMSYFKTLTFSSFHGFGFNNNHFTKMFRHIPGAHPAFG